MRACTRARPGATASKAVYTLTQHTHTQGYDQQNRASESIWLHPVQDAEIKPKK